MNDKQGTMTMKVGIVSLGCAKNLVNTEQMMFLLNKAGFVVTGETTGADVVIVNTCGFIESAKMEAIETILELGSEKDQGKIGKIIVTGCLAQRYKSEMLAELPEVDGVVGVGSFEDIVSAVRSALRDTTRPELFGDINAPVSETGRILTTSPAWAYLKIAEGCDNRCAYCAIPDIRGRFRSRPIGRVIDEARDLAGRGIKELIIVAQDVTRYGLDLYGKRRLPDLLKGLCGIDALKWIRLHYLYPDEIEDELIEVIAKYDKIVKYLDIPIQHINDGILKKMNRRGTGSEIRTLLQRLREQIPGVVLRTSIIAALPGEGDMEFEELCGFLMEAKLERAGVFQYSPEEGTAAALMEAPDADTAKLRAERLTDMQSRIMDAHNESRIGSIATVLVEGCEDGRFYGRSFAESPDIDGYISIRGNGVTAGEFIDVLITGVENGELVGCGVT